MAAKMRARHHRVLDAIAFRSQRLCVIDKEDGDDRMKVELVTDLYLLPKRVTMKFDLSAFDEAIRQARADLAACS
ncbi:hypothetical protein [Burkholderia pseudomultivorans]|uniref:Uncharacterized protein n=1 Tax=Burkholderia pseudomultivorans TaxID=1207504 RepID=A0A6P2LAI4_9BURK|nr:hypothetical protein [Burkholderia pseudomultivorans]MDR8729526.1 hypothetical protein [Burkholderia pseudomultivorans]MDR8737308.1 hypothetical protein [Burkholderia pseudomultivorans]MDR8743450.1 hypothetical protein [Burkholderia pseudomultivorans]MDR8757085.1 hypothetical protein [Burkholderia pseudomultivorans]MDR8780069.1 hypothetical protein [Burkholderia pseudomultivorans]